MGPNCLGQLPLFSLHGLQRVRLTETPPFSCPVAGGILLSLSPFLLQRDPRASDWE